VDLEGANKEGHLVAESLLLQKAVTRDHLEKVFEAS